MSKPSTIRSEIFGLKNAAATSDRRYQRWTEEEMVKLLSLVRKKKTLQEMADAHQRTKTSIKTKLRCIAADYYFNDKRPIEEIEKYTGLSKEDIMDAIRNRKYKDEINEIKREDKEEERAKAKRDAEVASVSEAPSELEALKKDVAEMKADIKEILRIIQSLV